jgi:hypothetical protein
LVFNKAMYAPPDRIDISLLKLWIQSMISHPREWERGTGELVLMYGGEYYDHIRTNDNICGPYPWRHLQLFHLKYVKDKPVCTPFDGVVRYVTFDGEATLRQAVDQMLGHTKSVIQETVLPYEERGMFAGEAVRLHWKMEKDEDIDFNALETLLESKKFQPSWDNHKTDLKKYQEDVQSYREKGSKKRKVQSSEEKEK